MLHTCSMSTRDTESCSSCSLVAASFALLHCMKVSRRAANLLCAARHYIHIHTYFSVLFKTCCVSFCHASSFSKNALADSVGAADALQ